MLSAAIFVWRFKDKKHFLGIHVAFLIVTINNSLSLS